MIRNIRLNESNSDFVWDYAKSLDEFTPEEIDALPEQFAVVILNEDDMWYDDAFIATKDYFFNGHVMYDYFKSYFYGCKILLATQDDINNYIKELESKIRKCRDCKKFLV